MNIRWAFISPSYFIHPTSQVIHPAQMELFSTFMDLSREESLWNEAVHQAFLTTRPA